MSARDDLAAAMGKLDAFDRAANGPGDPSYTRLQRLEYEAKSAALQLLRKHGKRLLALLDAEPVGYTLQRDDGTFAGGFWLPRDIDHAEEEARKSWEWGNNYSVAALYARPEASDE